MIKFAATSPRNLIPLLAILCLPTLSRAAAPVFEVIGDLVVDTDTLKVDSTNNRVGIGTASPTTMLQVTGSAKFDTDYRANTWKNLDGNNAATLATGASPALTITNSLVVPSINVSGLTASRALITDGSKNLTSASVTGTELGYLSGVTSAIQTQLGGKQASDATLSSLASFNTNGILTQTAADTFTGRTIAGTVGQVTLTNGSGVSGNPTIGLPAQLGINLTTPLATVGGGATDLTSLYNGWEVQSGRSIGVLDATTLSILFRARSRQTGRPRYGGGT